jgi:MFS family permease
MGSWGGSGFAALFGGLMAQNIGWRWIFIIAAIVSVIGMLMVRGTPESKAPPKPGYKFDLSREAAFFALAANLVMAAAVLSIMITVPKGRAVERMEPAPAAGVAQPATQEK